MVLLPLCLMRSLHALAPFSALGLAGTLLTAAVMAIRLADGSYSPQGRFFSSLPVSLRPSFGVTSGLETLWSPSSFILISMLSTAFVAHYHAPRLYQELEERSAKRFMFVVATAFSASSAIYVLMMACGYLTFGGSSTGFILNNYATTDPLAMLARLAVGVTLLTGYPLIFFALRDGIIDLFNLRRAASSPLVLRAGSALLLLLLTGLAASLEDVGFVVSISGALCGCTLMFVFPAIMSMLAEARRAASIRDRIVDLEYSSKYWRSEEDGSILAADIEHPGIAPLRAALRRSLARRLMSVAMLIVGVLMGALGVLVSVAREFEWSL